MNGDDAAREARVVSHDERPRTHAIDDEVDLVSKVPGIIDRCSREHRSRRRRRRHLRSNESRDEIGLESELLGIGDVLP